MTSSPLITWKVKLDFGMDGTITGYRESLDRLTPSMLMTAKSFQCATYYMERTNDVIKAEKRKQKSIDRIAWKAEAAQRHAKRGNWK